MIPTALTSYQFTIDAAITEWFAQKETRTGSHKTRQAYQDTIRPFRATLSRGRLDLLSNPIDVARVATLWANMRAGKTRRPGQDVSPSTYNQRLAILSSWYSFVRDVYKLEIPNPIESVKKRPVQAYASALPLAPEAVETRLEAIDRGTRQGMREYALLSVALYTGRRASELAGLCGADVRIQGRTDHRIHLTFRCRGEKVMHDLLDTETSAVLLEYLHAHYGKQLLTLKDDAAIWVSYSKQNKGQPISTKTLANICQRYLGDHLITYWLLRNVDDSGLRLP